MSRITISLPPEMATYLAREARRRGTSVSEVVRSALSVQLELFPGNPRKVPFAALGKSGKHHTARDAEKILAKEWANAGRS